MILKKALEQIKNEIVSHSFTYANAVQFTFEKDIEIEFDDVNNKMIVKEKDEDMKINNMIVIKDENGRVKGYQKKSRPIR